MGVYPSYISHIPDTYTKSIMKALVSRALEFSPSRLMFDVEINKIKQVLVNNNLPLFLVDSVARRSLSKYLAPTNETPKNSI